MDEVDYLSSTFLRVCFMVAKKSARGQFSIINTNQFVEDLLITSGLENIARIELRKQEEKIFPPRPEFAKTARINSLEEYKRIYDESIHNKEKFWGEEAKKNIEWFAPFEKVLEWDLPLWLPSRAFGCLG